LSVTREVAADKMRVADSGIDALSKFIPRPNVEIVADKIATSSCYVAIKTRVGPRARIAIEKVIKEAPALSVAL
jgi:hypothetical protein